MKANSLVPQMPFVIQRDNATNDIVSSNTEATLLSVTVPANNMGTDRTLYVVTTGDYLNNSGGAATFTLKVKFGGTIVYQQDSASYTANAARRPWHLFVWVENNGATNAQRTRVLTRLINPATAPATGLGDLASMGSSNTAKPLRGADSTIDTTVSRTMDITIQHSANNASLSMRRLNAMAVIL